MPDSNIQTKTYEGLICQHSYGEASDILFLSSIEDPLCEALLWMSGKQVSVRYWITDQQITKDQASEDHLTQVMGLGAGQFGARYSEITGYLWTDEELAIGGHDLIAELDNAVGKWLILEVDWKG